MLTFFFFFKLNSKVVNQFLNTDMFQNMFPVFDLKNKIFMTEQIPEDKDYQLVIFIQSL
jgi:hypothetical protein